ncbi:putative bifunctional diguanylate cyclase/phosphodiesterase [Alkaliphilus hydrothermalis]|uniref:Diguanylate cyclase (GGDEF)-like protein n=1 Tax=Alkaliphilus hydrothermalis TaxID=1482730 RepID=A0ABS2NRB4_9FIRM|nr:bifunctional diguanylate cyclase/phosphodiesterase [Alkaliphilus hydrothermalis]MBM7615475.1 diguanylate cyclase (GGDEF)-like protein [Alkaliphilus hydrothermalis]
MLQHLKRQKSFMLPIGIIIIAIISTSLYGLWNLGILNSNISKFRIINSQNDDLYEIRKAFLEIRMTVNTAIAKEDYSITPVLIVDAKDRQIKTLLHSYEMVDGNSDKLIKLRNLRFNYESYIRQLQSVNDRLKNREVLDTDQITNLKMTGDNIIETIDEITSINNDTVKNLIQITHYYYRSKITYVAVILLLCTLFLVWAYVRVIFKINKAEEQTKYIAYYDSLTKLPNQTYLFKEISSKIKEFNSVSDKKMFIFFINIDDFKVVNNTLDYEYGDQLLQSVASKLRIIFNDESKYFVSRFGGDEFALLISEVHSIEEITELAENLIKLFHNPWSINNQEIYIGSSIGISHYPEDGDDSNILLQRANIAMSKAKELGKNQFQFFQLYMYNNILNTKEMVVKIRHALQNDEFCLYYQPQIDSKTGKIVGVEALIRWMSPEFGIIPPMQFISIAETTGLIVDMGKWIIERACRQNKDWQSKGFPPVYMAVNISAVQLQHKDFLSIINELLNKTALDPEYLELEITESVLMESIDTTLGTLQALKNVGVKISLDDFGTGFSSLNYLRKLPINTLKIDRSFITNIENNPVENDILETIISLAHKLNLNVIAEGVETLDQLHHLVEKKCDHAQGYLISKPLPAEELERFMAQGYIQF